MRRWDWTGLAVAGAMASTFLAAQPALAERPASDFAHLPAIDDPYLSPSGKKIIALTSQEGQTALVIFNSDRSGQSTRISVGDVDLNWFRWVNDEWIIANVGVDQRDTGIYATRLLAFRSDGTKMHYVQQKEVGQHAGEVIWTAGDGSPRILLAAQKSLFLSDPGFWPEVSMVDVASNKFDKVVFPKEGVFDWFADGTGTVRVGVGDENGGRSQRLLYRDDGSQGFREVANSAKDKSEFIAPVAFLGQTGKAAAFSDRSGWDALYMIDLATMQVGPLLYEVPGYDLGSVLLDLTESQIRGVRFTDTRRHTVWFNPEMQQVQAGLEGSLPGQAIDIVSSSADDRTFVVHATSASAPGSYYLLSLDSSSLVPLGSENPGIGKGPFGSVRTIQYSARDGLKINAVLTLPPGKEAKNLPLIVLPHGGPAARDREEWDFWTQFLADRGYAVIQPNYRGSSGFGNAFQAAGDGEWGMKMQDDVDDARGWAVSTGLADGKRVCIAGGSYGGYVAMRAADRNPDLYRCAISFAGVSDIPAVMRYDQQFINALATQDYWRSRAPDLRSISPIANVEKVGIPVLLVHGAKDRRVPLAQSGDYAEKLRKAGKDVEYFVQPKGDHHFSREQDRLSFLQQMEAFLDKHNPAN